MTTANNIPAVGTAIQRDPNNMIAFGISCANRPRKKLKGWQKANKKK